MHFIQNSPICTPSSFSKAIEDFTYVLPITAVALIIIGLTAALFKKTKEQAVFQSAPSQLRPSDLSSPNPQSLEMKIPHFTLLSTSKEIKGTVSLFQQPQEIILHIFSYLNPTQLAKCGEVSRRWGKLATEASLWNAFNLRTISPSLKVFDETDWVTFVDLSSFGLEVTDAPSIDKRQAIPFLKRCFASLPIEGNTGITLLTIPKGLTFNTLIKIASSSKRENTPMFSYIWNRISSEIGDIAVDKTYRIVMTHTIFKKSRNLTISHQKALVSKIGCEMPKVLEATLLLVVTFMSFGERLYSDNPLTYTRCLEQLSSSQIVVGNFSTVGICIYQDDGFVDDDIGVGGVFRLF